MSTPETKAPETKAVERKEYTLTQPHTHAGEELKAGDKVRLTQRQAEFIKDKISPQPAARKEG